LFRELSKRREEKIGNSTSRKGGKKGNTRGVFLISRKGGGFRNSGGTKVGEARTRKMFTQKKGGSKGGERLLKQKGDYILKEEIQRGGDKYLPRKCRKGKKD